MRNICAYLLNSMGSNPVNIENMKAILASVGVEADDNHLKMVIERFANKPVDKTIALGATMLSAGGGGGAPVAASSGGSGAAAPKAEEEEKKEEKKEESEESDDDMGFGLFD